MTTKLVHRGMGSDLVGLCGKMEGISGHDQVTLTYVDEQITCPDCIKTRMQEAIKAEKVLRLIVEAALTGHVVTVQVTPEEEHNSDRWLAVEAKNYLCLLASPHASSFKHTVADLAKGLE